MILLTSLDVVVAKGILLGGRPLSSHGLAI